MSETTTEEEEVEEEEVTPEEVGVHPPNDPPEE